MPYIALAIGIVLAGLDQLFKYLIVSHFELNQTQVLIPNILNLTYIRNEGVAFGMFSGMPWVFIALTSVMLAAIIIYMFVKRPKSKFFYFTIALIIGGGIGNLIDRIAYGYVVDYLSLSFFHPVCNFADYCITLGVIMLAVYLLFFADKKDKKVRKHDGA